MARKHTQHFSWTPRYSAKNYHLDHILSVWFFFNVWGKILKNISLIKHISTPECRSSNPIHIQITSESGLRANIGSQWSTSPFWTQSIQYISQLLALRYNNTPHSSTEWANLNDSPSVLLHSGSVNWMYVQTTLIPFIQHVRGWCMFVTVRTLAQFHMLSKKNTKSPRFQCYFFPFLCASLSLSQVSQMTLNSHDQITNSPSLL